MTVEIVALVCGLVFAMFSLTVVLWLSYLRDKDSSAESPTGLSRRMGDYELQRVFEPFRSNQLWYREIWPRLGRAVAVYLRCKRRTTPGRIDIAIVLAFISVAALSWSDVVFKILEILEPKLQAGGAQ